MIEQVKIMPRQTVLVVDDESSIRDMLVISLDAAGYNVLQAENAQNPAVPGLWLRSPGERTGAAWSIGV